MASQGKPGKRRSASLGCGFIGRHVWNGEMKFIDLQEGSAGDDSQFWEILYDENLAKGNLCFSERLIRQTGGINQKLRSKQSYELLLRAADGRRLSIGELDDEAEAEAIREANALIVDDNPEDNTLEGIRTDCYIVGRYSDKLLKKHCFDEVVESVILQAGQYGLRDEAISLLESMLQKGEEYYKIADDTEPILLYTGESVCHNMLNMFALEFGEALEKKNQKVEYFDWEAEGNQAITRMIGRHFKAVIAFQFTLFSLKLKDGTYLHDAIYAPKYNFVFDHPVWIKMSLQSKVKNLHVLTHDTNYVCFAQRYYNKKAILFPPAGMMPDKGEFERIYDISFVGTIGDYLQEVALIHQMDRATRFLANRFLLKMRKNPNMTSEDALAEVLSDRGCHCSDDEFVDIFYQLRRVIYCVMHYYRYKVIETLLESGLRIDAFGNNWGISPLSRYPNLICHPDISADQSTRIYQRSKCSLNVMAWHKGGFTERMAGIMLCGAVLVTDKTTYLDGRFDAEHDMIVFDLEEMEQLPDKIKAYMNDDKMREEMAQNGKKKAMERHTWDKRADQFLNEILQS